MAAKERGATIIHVDPHFSRTSQHADIYAPLRVGTDIAFVGGLINYILQNELYFKEYVTAYTNATFIVGEDYQDAEDLEGVFSGLRPNHSAYDTSSWQYQCGPPPMIRWLRITTTRWRGTSGRTAKDSRLDDKSSHMSLIKSRASSARSSK